jgi:ribonuclease J
MTRLTFYGGVNEVGGNKILLEDRDVRIFLDFGMSFAQRRRFWLDPYLSPRKEDDLIELGLLPDLFGVYKFDESPSRINASFLTHSHMDHAGYVSMLKPDIPVVCSPITHLLLEGLATIRSKSFETDISETSFRPMKSGKLRLDSLEIESLPIDHSVPGANAYLIHTPAGYSIAYTGDYRLTGTRSALTKEFMERLRELRLDVLITEATNLVGARVSSEQEIRQKLDLLAKSCQKLLIANFAYGDVDRFRTFYEVARANDRMLAISTRQAYLFSRLLGFKELELPDLAKDPSILIYVKEKKRYLRWEREIIDKFPNVRPSSGLRELQARLILTMTFWDLAELVDVRPEAGSCYVFSMSEPMNEEQELEYVKLVNWLEHYGLPQYHVHTSGHVMPHELRWIVEELKPKTVIPVHTEHPLLFKKYAKGMRTEVNVPRFAQPIEIK